MVMMIMMMRGYCLERVERRVVGGIWNVNVMVIIIIISNRVELVNYIDKFRCFFFSKEWIDILLFCFFNFLFYFFFWENIYMME